MKLIRPVARELARGVIFSSSIVLLFLGVARGASVAAAKLADVPVVEPSRLTVLALALPTFFIAAWLWIARRWVFQTRTRTAVVTGGAALLGAALHRVVGDPDEWASLITTKADVFTQAEAVLQHLRMHALDPWNYQAIPIEIMSPLSLFWFGIYGTAFAVALALWLRRKALG